MASQTTELKLLVTSNTEALNKVASALANIDKHILASTKNMQAGASASGTFASNQAKVSAAVKKTATDMGAVNAALGRYRQDVAAAGGSTTQLAAAAQALTIRLKAAGYSATQTRSLIAGMGQASQQAVKQQIQLGRETERAAAAANRASKSYNDFGSSIRSTIVHVTGALIVYRGLVESFSATVFAAADFDEQMRNVNTIAQLSERGFQGLSNTVLDAAGSLEFGGKSAVELASGLYNIHSSGFDGAAALQVLSVASRAAAAGVTDAATAGRVLLGILNAYGMAAGEAEGVADLLFQTVNLGIISFEELASSMGTIMGAASNLRVDLTDLGAAIITMTRNGIPAHETMTSINQVLVSILDPAEQSKRRFEELGIAYGQSALEGRSLVDVMAEIQAKTQGSSQAQAELFGNVRALRGVMSILADDGVKFAQFQEDLANSSGALSKAYEQNTKSLAFQFKAAFAEIQATIIRDLGPALVEILHIVKENVGAIIPIVQDLLRVFVDIAPTLSNLIGLFGAFMNSISDLPTVALIAGAAFLLFGNQVFSALNRAYLAADLLIRTFASLGVKQGLGMATSLAGFGGILGGVTAAVFGLDMALSAITGEGIFDRIFGGGPEEIKDYTFAVMELNREISVLRGERGEISAPLGEFDQTALDATIKQFLDLQIGIESFKGSISELGGLDWIGNLSLEEARLELQAFNHEISVAEFDQLVGNLENLVGPFDTLNDGLEEGKAVAKAYGEAFVSMLQEMGGTSSEKLDAMFDLLNSIEDVEVKQIISDVFMDYMRELAILSPGPLADLILSGKGVNKGTVEAHLNAIGSGLLNLSGSAETAADDLGEITNEADEMAKAVEDASKRASDALSTAFDAEKAILDLQRLPLEAEKAILETEQRMGRALDDAFDDTDRGKELISLIEDLDNALAGIDDSEAGLDRLIRQIDGLVTAGKGGLGIFGDIARELDGMDEALQFAHLEEGLTDLVTQFPNIMNEKIFQDLLAFPAEFRGTIIKNLGDIAQEVDAVSITFNEMTKEFEVVTADGTTLTFDADILKATDGVDDILDKLTEIPPKSTLNFDVGDDIFGEIDAVKQAAAGAATNYMLNFMASYSGQTPSGGGGAPAPASAPSGPPPGPIWGGAVAPSSRSIGMKGVSDMQTVVDALNTGFSTLNVSLSRLQPQQEAALATINDLAAMSAEVVQVFQDYAAQFSEEGIDSASNFASSANTIYGMVAGALEASDLLANSVINSPSMEKIDNLAEMASKFVGAFANWASFFVTIGEEGDNVNPAMQSAQEFAQTAGSIMGIIADTLVGFEALDDWNGQVPNLSQITLFAEGIAKFIDAFAAVMGPQHSAGNLEGISALANTGGGIVSLISDTIGAFEGIEDFQVPDPQKIWEVLTSVRDALQYAIILTGEIFDELQDPSLEIYSEENMTGVGLFADGGSSIISLISNTIEAFKGIQRFRPPDPQKVWEILTSVRDALQLALIITGEIFDEIEDSWDIYSEENINGIGLFAQGGGSIIDLIANAIEALDGIKKFRPPSVENIRSILSSVKDAVDTAVEFLFSDDGESIFSDAQLEKAELWAGTAGSLVDLIATAIEALDFKKVPKPDTAAIDALLKSINTVVHQVADLVDTTRDDPDHLTKKLLERASLWAQTAADIVAIIGDAVGAFKNLSKFNAPSEDSLSSFVSWLGKLVQKISDAAKQVDGLNKASKFAEVAGTIISAMANMEEATDSVRNFKVPPESAVDVLVDWLKDLVRKFGEAAKSPELKGLLGAARRLAETVSGVMQAVSDSFDAFKAIRRFRDPSENIGAFMQGIVNVITEMASHLKGLPPQIVDAASDVQDAIETTIGGFTDAVENLNSINNIKKPSSADIQDLMDSIVEVVEAMSDHKIEKDITQAAIKFNKVVGKALSNIAAAVEGLNAIRGFTPVSGNSASNFAASIVNFVKVLVDELNAQLPNAISEAELALVDAANSVMGLISSAASALQAASEAALVPNAIKELMERAKMAVTTVVSYAGDFADLDTAIAVLTDLAPFFTEIQNMVAAFNGAGQTQDKGGAAAGEGQKQGRGGDTPEEKMVKLLEQIVELLGGTPGSRGSGNSSGTSALDQEVIDAITNREETSIDKLEDLFFKFGSKFSGSNTVLEGLQERLSSIQDLISQTEQEITDLFSETAESQQASTALSVFEGVLAQMRIQMGYNVESMEELIDRTKELKDELSGMFDTSLESAQMGRAATVLQGFLRSLESEFESFMEGGLQIDIQDFVLTPESLEASFGSMSEDMVAFLDKILRQNKIIGQGESVMGQGTLTLQSWLEELNNALEVSNAIDAALDAFAEGMTAEEKMRTRLINRWDRLFSEWQTAEKQLRTVRDAMANLPDDTVLTTGIFTQVFGADMGSEALSLLTDMLKDAGLLGQNESILGMTLEELNGLLEGLGAYSSDQQKINDALKAFIDFQTKDATRSEQIEKLEELRSTLEALQDEESRLLHLIEQATREVANNTKPIVNGGGGGGGGGGGIPGPDYDAMPLTQLAMNVGNLDVDDLANSELRDAVYNAFEGIESLMESAQRVGGGIYTILSNNPGTTLASAVAQWWQAEGYPSNLVDDFIDWANITNMADGGVAMPVPGGHIMRVAEAGRPEAILPLDQAGMFGAHLELSPTIIIDGSRSPQETKEAVKQALVEFVEEIGIEVKGTLG